MTAWIQERDLIPGWPDAYPTVHARLDALDAAGLVHWPERGAMPSLMLVPRFHDRATPATT